MFFRDGQKEEIACQGALIAEKLVKSGVFDVQDFSGKPDLLWEKRNRFIDSAVCENCPFKEEDCDFQSENPSDDLEPCGGYILLSILVDDGIISETILRNEIER